MECADKRSRAPKLNTGDAPKLGKAQDPWQVTFLILVLVVLLFAWCPPASVYATLGLFLVFIIAFLHALWPMMVFYHEDCKHTDHKRPAEEAPTKLCRGSQISLEVGGIEEIEAPISAEDITSPAMECADKRSGAPKLNTGDAPKLGKAQNPWQVSFLMLVLVVLQVAWEGPPVSVYAGLVLFLFFIITFLHTLWPMMVFYHENCEHTDHKRPAEEAPTKLCRGSHENKYQED